MKEFLIISLNCKVVKEAWAGNFRMDTFNPDCLIRISNEDTFNFCSSLLDTPTV